MPLSGFSRMKQLPLSALLWAAAVVAHVLIVVFGAQGLRGSDQYWYAADLVMGRLTGMPASNSIYPLVWSAPQLWSPDALPPPIHNIPIVYISSLFNSLFADEYATWVTLNTILAVASSLLLFWLAQRITSSMVAAFVAALFLLSPQTTWFSLNALSEQFIVFLALVIVAGSALLTRKPWLGLLFMAAATILLVASRENFLVILPLELFFIGFLMRKKLLRWREALTFTLAVALGLVAIRTALAPYPSSGWKGALTIGTPREFGSMSAFFFSDPHPSFEQLVSKAGQNFVKAIVPANPQDVFFETLTVVLLVVGVIFIRKTARAHVMIFWGLAFFAIYLATCVVFQAQSRYIAAVTPLAILLAVVGAKEFLELRHVRPRSRALLAGATLLITVVFSLILTWEYRTSSVAETSTMQATKAETSTWNDGGVLSLNLPLGSTIELGYAVAPNLVLVDVESPSQPCLTEDLASHWNLRHVVAPIGTTVDDVRAILCDATLSQESVHHEGMLTAIKGPFEVFSLTLKNPENG